VTNPAELRKQRDLLAKHVLAVRKGCKELRERVETALNGWKKILVVERASPAAYPGSQAVGSVEALTEVLKWIDNKIPNTEFDDTLPEIKSSGHLLEQCKIYLNPQQIEDVAKFGSNDPSDPQV